MCFPHARLLMVLGTREKKMAKAVSKDTRRAGGREGGRAGGWRARATPGAAEDEPQCAHLQLAARTQQTTPLSSRAGNRRRGPEKGRGRTVAARGAKGQGSGAVGTKGQGTGARGAGAGRKRAEENRWSMQCGERTSRSRLRQWPPQPPQGDGLLAVVLTDVRPF